MIFVIQNLELSYEYQNLCSPPASKVDMFPAAAKTTVISQCPPIVPPAPKRPTQAHRWQRQKWYSALGGTTAGDQLYRVGLRLKKEAARKEEGVPCLPSGMRKEATWEEEEEGSCSLVPWGVRGKRIVDPRASLYRIIANKKIRG
jgi:hypothetical protein